MMKATTPLPMLGGMTIAQFLTGYWQKKPLLIRQSMPDVVGMLNANTLFEAAMREDVESRLVQRRKKDWQLRTGPFEAFPGDRARSPWTLLVQGMNTFLPQADELLRRFSFVPYARLDDVMASYAIPGGGVGPHFDNYDVFLLQITGHRRWSIGAQNEFELVEGAPLRILSNFESQQTWDLAPGDMLYLPPHWAHDGVALDECITCSIGFRAPPAEEIASAFLDHLQDRLAMSGRYTDPDLVYQSGPAKLGSALIDQYFEIIDRIRWNRQDVEEFTGCQLTEPKSHIFFEPPGKPLPEEKFRKRCLECGIRLDLRTLMLYSGKKIFINGESVSSRSAHETKLFHKLADQRRLSSSEMCGMSGETILARIYDWYRAGFLSLDE